MKIEVDTRILANSLYYLSSALSANPEFAILSYIHCLCEKTNGRIILTTSNIETNVISECKADIDSDQNTVSFLIPAKQFINIITNSNADKTQLKFDQVAMSLRYNLDQTSGKLKCLPAEDFPVPVFGHSNSIDVSVYDLSKLITQAIIACDSPESTRIALTGVYITVEDDILQAISGDGYRLALCRIKLGSQYSRAEAVVPSKYLKPLRSILRKFDDDFIIKLRLPSTQNNKIMFEFGDMFIATQVLADPFPNVNGVFTNTYDTTIQVPVSGLTESINIHNSYAVNENSTTYFKSNKDSQYCMVSRDPEGGAVGTVIADLDQSLKLPNVCFNIKFLSDFIKVCADEDISIYLGTESSPICIRPLQDNTNDINGERLGYTYYIMPIGNDGIVDDIEYAYPT